MAKIRLSDSSDAYDCVIDTKVMEVEIRETFLGVLFVTEDGEHLAVSMRDNGFEVHYTGIFGSKGFDAGWFDFKAGNVTRQGGEQIG